MKYQAKGEWSFHLKDEYVEIFDLFPNWQNSLQTTNWLMIGHALSTTNLNTLYPHMSGWRSSKVQKSGVQLPAWKEEIFNPF